MLAGRKVGKQDSLLGSLGSLGQVASRHHLTQLLCAIVATAP
jgi:hypothetical protein